MFHLLYSCERIPEPIASEACWNPQPVWKFWRREEHFASCCDWTPRPSTP